MKCDGSGTPVGRRRGVLATCPACRQSVEVSLARRLIVHDVEPPLRLQEAVARVRRLSEAGTPQRLFALQEVAAAMGLSAGDIADALSEVPSS